MKELVFSIAIFLSLAALMPILPATPAFADKAADVKELQRQIDERNENIKKLEQEIAKYQAEADKTSAAAMTLANTIKTLEATGRKLDTDIKLTQQKISATSLTINKLAYDINDKEARIAASRQALGENIRQLAEKDNTSIIQNFLSKKNISEAWNDVVDMVGLQTNLREHIAELGGTKLALLRDKNENEEKKSELSQFVSTLTGQKTVLAANKNEKSQLLSETKNQEAEYQKMIADREAMKTALEKEVFDYESKLKYTIDPTTIPKKGSAPFAWPLDNIYITQQFGVTNASSRLYVSGSHNGTDFRAPVGTPVKAMGSGTVIGTGDTDLACKGASFGRWVLIRYDSNLAAIFAHLSVISTKEGAKVNTGDIVGYSGNTGYSTGPHLHVSVYPGDAVKVENRPSIACGGKVYRMPIAATTAYLDPLAYMPKL